MPGYPASHLVLKIIPSGLTILILVFLISMTIRTGKINRESQLFTIICLLFLTHHSMIILFNVFRSPIEMLYIIRGVHPAFIFILPVSIHGVHQALSFPHTRKILPFFYGITCCLVPFVFTRYYLSVANDRLVAGPLLVIYLVISLVVLFVYAVLIIIRLIRKPDYPNSVKALFVLIGLFPAYLLTYWNALPLIGIRTFPLSGFVFIPMGLLTFGILRYGILNNRGWFSVDYIPNFLTALVWLPPVLALMLYLAARNTLFYPDITDRLFPWALPAILTALVCFCLASFSFQEGSRKVQTMIFGGICALWGMLNLDITLLFILKDKQTALIISRFDHFFLVMQFGLLGHLFYYFTEIRKWVVYLAYGISLAFVPLTQTDLYLKGMYTYPWGLFGKGGGLFYVLTGIMALGVTVKTGILIKKIRRTNGGRGERHRYVMFLLSIIFMALCCLLNLPAMSGVNIFPFGTFMAVPVIMMSYVIFKYDIVKVSVYSKRRFWDGAAVILTYTGYILLVIMIYTVIVSLPSAHTILSLGGSGIPLMISLVVSAFFSMLSLRVAPDLTGSRLFGLICMLFAFISTDILLNRLVADPQTGLRISRFSHVFLTMWPALYTHLVVLICREHKYMPVVLLSYGFGVCIALFSQSSLYLTGMKHYSWGFFAQAGPVFAIYYVFGFIMFVFNIVIFYKSDRKPIDPLFRNQLVFFSLGLGTSAWIMSGNIPAMYGIDFQPLGNYVFIPLALFGYAMFRKNLKDVLTLLYQSLFSMSVIVFAVLISVGFVQTGYTRLSWWMVFSGITVTGILFAGYRRVSTAVLGLFFGRQQEMLDRLYLRLTDRLSKSRSLNDLSHLISDPLLNHLHVKTLRILFYNPEDKTYSVFGPFHSPGVKGARGSSLCAIPVDHPVLSLFRDERSAITQARLEARIADTETSLDSEDLLRSADIIQPVYYENTLICLLMFYGKKDGSVYSKIEQAFIERLGLILGPYIENARLLQNLEAQIEHRTRDLTDALKVKDDFLARMSHEVRSPLNAILGMGELLAETRLTEEQARFVDIQINSTGLLLSVINDILDFSKLDANRVTLENIPFDLITLMGDLKDMVAVSARKKGLPITLSISGDVPPYVSGDPYKLAQVIINLADNAVRFTEQGGITFKVTRVSNDTMKFSVEDTGRGINPQHQTMIFERFTQEESSTTRRFGGTGLGLTISRRLVELMEGDLSVTSEVGKGSCFFFTLNLPQVDKSAIKDCAPLNSRSHKMKILFEDRSAEETIDVISGSETPVMLLAEDITSNVHVIRNYLKSQPISIDVASDGAQAVRMFREKAYDMVLMDIHMPVMDGYQAVSKIRAWEQKKGLKPVPVVALTAHRPDTSRENIREKFDAFLLKPIGKQDLIQTMTHFLPLLKVTDTTCPGHLDPIDPELSDLIPDLLSEMREGLSTISECLGTADYDTAIRLSHGFKGAAGNYRLTRLYDLFHALHEQCFTQKPTDAKSMIIVIRDLIDALLLRFGNNDTKCMVKNHVARSDPYQ